MLDLEIKERYLEELSRQMELNLGSGPILIDTLKDKIGSVTVDLEDEDYNESVTSVDIIRVIDAYPEVFDRYHDVCFLKSFERWFWLEVIYDYCKDKLTKNINYIDLFNYVVKNNKLLESFGLELFEAKPHPLNEKYFFNDDASKLVFEKVQRILKRFVFVHPEIFGFGEDGLEIKINNDTLAKLESINDSRGKNINDEELTALYRKKFPGDSISELSLILHSILALAKANISDGDNK